MTLIYPKNLIFSAIRVASILIVKTKWSLITVKVIIHATESRGQRTNSLNGLLLSLKSILLT